MNLPWLPLQRALTLIFCLIVFGIPLLYAQSAVEVAKLLANDGASNDSFGFSVDIDGDTAVVGAHFHDHQGTESGAAYVFVRDGDTWVEQAELLPSDGKALDQTGFNQIAVDGDTILLGAHRQEVDGDANAGAVYVFERDGANWSEMAKLVANDRQQYDGFGVTVALDGDTAIIGANGDDNPNGSKGSVYVFVRNDNTWTQQAILVGRDIQLGTTGFAEGEISIEDDTVAVGAWATGTQGQDSGTVYIFVRNGNTWSEQAKLLPIDGKEEGQFGASTSLDHDTLMVGACRCHDPWFEGGAVYVYTRNGSIWTQQAKLRPADGAPDDNFGSSIKMVGDRAVIGASGARLNFDHFEEGAAYVFVRNDNTWTEQEKVLASDGEVRDNFGVSVSMEGDTIVIGAWEGTQYDPEGMDTGSAYIFELSTEFQINPGHSGAWFYPATSGQGQFLDIEAQSKFMFLSWFTYTGATSDHPNEQQWYTAEGDYSGNVAELEIFETLGGLFDQPQAVNTTKVGTATVTFNDCGEGHMTYHFDDGRVGQFPMQRVISGSGNTCEERSNINIEALDLNAGMDGAWFEQTTSGQGFFIDSYPDPEGGDFIFISWFTYGDETASGQRWLTAQGNYEGPSTEIDVFETTGGSFDDPTPPDTIKVGTMTIDFSDCSNAELSYLLTDDGLDGDISITRVVPGGQALCEELSGAD